MRGRRSPGPGRRTSYHTVGTAVGQGARSAAMNRASGSACVNRFGSSRSAPTSQAAYGIPQALPWNIGTTGSRRSCSAEPEGLAGADAQRVQERRAVAVDDALRACRWSRSCSTSRRLSCSSISGQAYPAAPQRAAPRTRCASGSGERSPSPYTIDVLSVLAQPPGARPVAGLGQAGVDEEHRSPRRGR